MKLIVQQRFGMVRAAILAGGQSQLYAEGWAQSPRLDLLGVRSVARLTSASGSMGFIKLADGLEALIDLPQGPAVPQGSAIEIEITAEARADKRARARLIGLSEGDPRRLSPPQSLTERLMAQARDLIDPDATFETEDDEDALDTAEAEALSPSFALPEGGYLSVEPTRALIACDVDMAAAGEGMARATKQVVKRVNEAALTEVARRVRLANLGGLVVVDLIGSRHEGDRLNGILRKAFHAEGPRIITGPVTRFGTFEFTRPWGATPHRDQAQTPLKAARRLLWAAVAEARNDPGGRLILRAPHRVLEPVETALKGGLDPLGPRLRLEADDRAVPTVVRAD